MYMDYLFYLKTLQTSDRIKQILVIISVFIILFFVGMLIEIFKCKFNKQYKSIKKFLNKLNIVSKKETKKDV